MTLTLTPVVPGGMGVGGNFFAQADYVLTSDGSTVKAYDKTGSITSSAASLHTVIAALSANTRVYLSVGTYTTTAEIIPQAGMVIQGAGLGTTILKIANGSITRTNAAGVRWRDVVFDGNQSAGFTGACINNTLGGDDARFIDCVIKNANTYGLVSANCSEVQVRGCTFTGNLVRDIFINPTNGVSRDCKITDCVLDGTGITSASSRLTASPGAGGTADFNGLQVIDNTFISGAGSFLLDLADGAGVASTGWVVKGNVGRQSAAGFGGFSFSGVGAGTCSGNTFDVNGFNATVAAFEVAGGSGVVVSNNTIIGGTTLTCGISVDGNVSSGHVISGNTINGLLSTAIAGIRLIANVSASQFSDITVSNNTVTWGGSGTGISGIVISTNNSSATCNRVMVTGNTVRGNGAGSTNGIKLTNNGAGTIDRCTIIGNCTTNVATPISRSGDTNTLIPTGTNQS